MKYSIDLSDELVEFFNSVFAVLDLKYTNTENMLKHVLLEGLEHRLEHFATNQSHSQHTKLHNIINEERAALIDV